MIHLPWLPLSHFPHPIPSYSSLPQQHTSFPLNRNTQPATLSGCATRFALLCFCMCCSPCLECFLPLPYPFIKLLSKCSLKCYLLLKTSLIFSENWCPLPLSSRTCNTKWQVLFHSTRMSSLEHRLKFHPSPVSSPTCRMKGSLLCPELGRVIPSLQLSKLRSKEVRVTMPVGSRLVSRHQFTQLPIQNIFYQGPLITWKRWHLQP